MRRKRGKTLIARKKSHFRSCRVQAGAFNLRAVELG
jgi:hypothetical protein